MAEQVLSVPNGAVDRPPKDEQRAWVRFATSQEACCQFIAVLRNEEGETGWWGRLRNVSTGGLALGLKRCFKAGSFLVIQISDRANGEPRRFPVRVASATAQANGDWLIGCEFLHPLSEEALQALLQE
jgi:hypothetical protein